MQDNFYFPHDLKHLTNNFKTYAQPIAPKEEIAITLPDTGEQGRGARIKNALLCFYLGPPPRLCPAGYGAEGLLG